MLPEIELFRRHLPMPSLDEIRRALSRVEEVPTLPGIVERVLALTADAEANVRELADVIAKDQAIAARILKIANSAYYAPRQEVRTISGAVMMLGFDEVKALCVAMKLVRAFPRLGEEIALSMEDFWRHSLAAGLIARIVATRAGLPRLKPEELFFAGLLHDFGKIVIHECFPKHFLVVATLAFRGGVDFFDLENRLLGVDHAWAGRFVAERWKIPKLMADVMAGHHNIPPAPAGPDGHAAECAAVHLADALAHRLLGTPYGPAPSPAVWSHLSPSLEAGTATLWGETDRIRRHLDEFFRGVR